MRNKLAYLGSFLLLLFFILGGAVIGYFYQIASSLPDTEFIRDYTPAQTTQIYANDNQKLARFCLEKRILVPLSQINQHLIDAVLAVEDANFYSHRGIYWPRVIQAFWKNLRAGSYIQGASTITQQLARSLFLYPQKTISRKIKEALLAYRIERKYSKQEILELYLNQIYFGNGAYGIEAAAESYFGKPAKDLKVAESALLAGLIRAPSKYCPFHNQDLAMKRFRVVLKRMHEEKFITEEQYQSALQFPFRFQENEEKQLAPYFTEYVRQYLEKQYGRSGLYKGGLQVYTTLNLNMQKIAQKSLLWGLEQLDKRQGFRPLPSTMVDDADVSVDEIQKAILEQQPVEEKLLGTIKEVLHDRVVVDVLGWCGEIHVDRMRWTKAKQPGEILKVGDNVYVRIEGYQNIAGEKSHQLILALEQEPRVQGALVALDPKTGFIQAMVGGGDYSKSKFNRAVQARRQPGSSFKPFIYAAALLQGKTLADIIIDSPIIYKDRSQEKNWKPSNYYEKFYGPTTLRKALEHSSNVVTVKLLKEVGIDYIIDLARKMGISSNLSPDLSLALGSSGVSLLELTSAFGVFANEGIYTPPTAIKWILDDEGEVVEKSSPSPQRVLDVQVNYLITSLLEGAVQHGTGWRAKSLGYPVAGKTGTTNDCIDAWFIGFSPDLVVGVWVGFDEYKSLGKRETGARVACPIWVKFMAEALRDKPIKHFPVPQGIVFVSIDADTGLQATQNCKEIILEAFRKGTEPNRLCDCREVDTNRFLSIDSQNWNNQIQPASPLRGENNFSPD
ncbi:MAG: penicillin-binding protein 1A [bacterium]